MRVGLIACFVLAAACTSETSSHWDDHPIRKALVDSSRELPGNLNETALFRNAVTQTPADGVIPYAVKVPFWSDKSHKARFVFVPPGSSVGFDETTERFRFPIGTVFAKHFSSGDGPEKYIETRVMVLRDNKKWAFRTYRWHSDQSTSVVKEVTHLNDVQTNHEEYRIPSEAECQGCHNGSRGLVLGFEPEQLNFNANATQHAMDLLAAKISFDANLSEIKKLPTFPDPKDAALDLDSRARSYLDVNCSYCHNPDGPAPFFDARRLQSLANTRMLQGGVIVPGKPDESLLYKALTATDPEKRMPFTSVHVDTDGAALIKTWIEQLTTPSTPE